MESKELLNIIKNYMYAQMDSNEINNLVDVKNTLSDAITAQVPHSQNKQDRNKKALTREEFIIRTLGHLRANPHLKVFSKTLNDTYVYINESLESQKPDGRCPNYNPASTMSLLKRLIKNSKEERVRYIEHKELLRNVHILYGEKGVGKTIFINHMFTKHNNLLNDRQVIWVRINLADNFGDLKPNLVHWINSKTTMVILKYYYKLVSLFDNMVDDLKAIIQEKFPSEKEQLSYMDELNYLVSIYSEKKTGEALSDNVISRWLANEILDYAIKKGYSYIFVLDNYDKLELTERYKMKLVHLRNELTRITGRDNIHGGSLLLVFRTETLDYLKTRNDPSTDKWNTSEYEIMPVEFDKIIYRKLDFITDYVKQYYEEQNWNIVDWPSHMDNFRNYLLQLSDTINLTSFIKYLDNMYSSNQRVKTQFIQLCYHDYLNQIKYKYRYKLVEAMCRSGYKLPPNPYNYEVKKNIIVIASQSKVYDNTFIPLIFSFPYCKDYAWRKSPISNTYLLLGIRILQFIKAYANLDDIESDTPMPFMTLSCILEKLYCYDQVITFLLVEELAEHGIIKVVFSNTLSPRNKYNIKLILLPKASFLLNSSSLLEVTTKSDGYGNVTPDNHYNFLHSIAYLNMCALRININESVLVKQIPMVKAISFSLNDKKSIKDWIFWKIINAITLMRIIRNLYLIELENEQRKKSMLSQSELNIYNNVENIDFDPMIENLLNQVNSIYKELALENMIEFDKLLEKYTSDWGNNIKP